MILSSLEKILIGFLAFAISIGGAYFYGEHVGKVAMENEYKAKELLATQASLIAVSDAAKAAQEKQARLDNENFDIAMKAQKAQFIIVKRTTERLNDIPYFITPKAAAACTVPFGLIRVLDAAASGSDTPDETNFPLPTGVTNDTPTAVDLTEVSASIVENYGRANGYRQQLADLQEAVVKLRAEFNQ